MSFIQEFLIKLLGEEIIKNPINICSELMNFDFLITRFCLLFLVIITFFHILKNKTSLFDKEIVKINNKNKLLITIIILSSIIFIINNNSFSPIHSHTEGTRMLNTLNDGDLNHLRAHFGTGFLSLLELIRPAIFNYKAIYYINLLLFISSGILITYLILIINHYFSQQKTFKNQKNQNSNIIIKNINNNNPSNIQIIIPLFLILYYFNPVLIKFSTTESLYFSFLNYYLLFLISTIFAFKKYYKKEFYMNELILSIITGILTFNTGTFSGIALATGYIFIFILSISNNKLQKINLKKIKPHIFFIIPMSIIFFCIPHIIIILLTLTNRIYQKNYAIESLNFLKVILTRLYLFDLNISSLIYLILIILSSYSFLKLIINHITCKNKNITSKNLKEIITLTLSILNIIIISFFIFSHVESRTIISDLEKEIILIPWIYIIIFIGIKNLVSIVKNITLESIKKTENYLKIKLENKTIKKIKFITKNITSLFILITFLISIIHPINFLLNPLINQKQIEILEDNIFPLIQTNENSIINTNQNTSINLVYLRTLEKPKFVDIIDIDKFRDLDWYSKNQNKITNITNLIELKEIITRKNKSINDSTNSSTINIHQKFYFYKGSICFYDGKFTDDYKIDLIKYYCNEFLKNAQPVFEFNIDEYYKIIKEQYDSKKLIFKNIYDPYLKYDEWFINTSNFILDPGMSIDNKNQTKKNTIGLYKFD
jgi:hypothetical protein